MVDGKGGNPASNADLPTEILTGGSQRQCTQEHRPEVHRVVGQELEAIWSSDVLNGGRGGTVPDQSMPTLAYPWSQLTS
ncbi:MAG: hypothetical protein OXG08_05015 [Gammaproteobacteria bacterium]|nr:hypothetical protein [Gammaproteobacteria bacterium]